MNAPAPLAGWLPVSLEAAVNRPLYLAIGYALLSLAGLAVLGIGDVPFTVDLLNHATRLFIECNADDPVLSRMWIIDYGIIPNLAIDLINLPLCGLVDPLTMVRGAMIVSLAGVLLLVWRIHILLHGEPNAFVLLAPAMTFNIITMMGYLNYLIGTFLFLLFAWSVLRYRLAERRGLIPILLPNLFGALLFFCHLFALGLAGLFYFGMQMQRSWNGASLFRRALLAGLWSAAAFALPLLLILLADRSGIGFGYTLATKVRTLWAVLIYASLPVAAVLVAMWSALLIWAFRERQIAISPAMRLPLGLLFGYCLLLPYSMRHAVDLDSRSLVATAYLAVASIGFRAGSQRTLHRTAAAWAASALALVTVAAEGAAALPKIRQYQKDVAEFRGSLDVIEPGQSLLSMSSRKRRDGRLRHLYLHLPSLATRDRGAFNPLEFSGKGMQPLRASAAFDCLDIPTGGTLTPEVARQLLAPETAVLLEAEENANLRHGQLWNRRFDVVAYFHYGSGGNPFPTILSPIHEGSFFTLFDVRTKTDDGSAPCGQGRPAAVTRLAR